MPRAGLLAILWTNGLDVKKPFEVKADMHRNLQKQVYKGKRFVGSERTDKEWLRSGCASLDAHIESTGDKSLQEELKGMGREGFGKGEYEKMVEAAKARDK